MTYVNYKDVVEYLNIEFVQVMVKLDTEYRNFKKLDLITNYEKIYEEVDEFIEDIDNKDLEGDIIAFWIDVNNYSLSSYQIFEGGEGIVSYSNNTTNQILLDFNTFLKLIS